MRQPQPIPERDVKQNSGVSASLALQAGQKAWELRQAAHGAADAKAREDILAKAINKEIEAESFGKAAKYTQSGTFQGLAAGAGLGVKPGVTLGKLTGALVGGTVSTVTGLLGGGIGSVYGAMNGPMWNLGQMASQGVQGVVGDWLPDWAATSSQKKALEKMVVQTKETQTPTKEELEQMKADAPDDMPETWSDTTKQMTNYIPSLPSLPSMPSMKGAGAALGLGGIGTSLVGGQEKGQPEMHQSQRQLQPESVHSNGTATGNPERRKPRKLASKANDSSTKEASSAPRKAPRKLETRQAAAA
ncbi:hypothetical protein EJ08DRAFT_580604 [Tothia fuscella]|uniref:Uncharacterized protein n=1 Tax=Tothia fuscella TaxID=1048955 RepID=A0A9P4P0X1_9PEZI|nr:hypothetical protein EJ08DRAFT_580604 [Tothia fuscella]